MTWYPSHNQMIRIVDEARKRLNNLRGRHLTRKYLYKLFGAYDQPGDSNFESREAFEIILNEGLLIKETPDRYRVATSKK